MATKVWFISDAHLGHANIADLSGENRPVKSCSENAQWIADFWNDNVSHKVAESKRDIVYCLGDMAFDLEGLELLRKLPGRKILIKGNHDDYLSTSLQLGVFEEIYGILRYKDWWLSHAPIHPDELRGKKNVHGHVHSATLPDIRYFNVCPESIYKNYGLGPMISLEDIRKYWPKIGI